MITKIFFAMMFAGCIRTSSMFILQWWPVSYWWFLLWPYIFIKSLIWSASRSTEDQWLCRLDIFRLSIFFLSLFLFLTVAFCSISVAHKASLSFDLYCFATDLSTLCYNSCRPAMGGIDGVLRLVDQQSDSRIIFF